MARAIGDLDNPHISEIPDVYFYNKSEYAYILLASDGLWDVLSDEQVCNIMNRYFTQYLQGSKHVAQSNPVQYMFNSVRNKIEDNTSILMAIL
jgi:serine/threonine protein phosphatase PrpC